MGNQKFLDGMKGAHVDFQKGVPGYVYLAMRYISTGSLFNIQIFTFTYMYKFVDSDYQSFVFLLLLCDFLADK